MLQKSERGDQLSLHDAPRGSSDQSFFTRGVHDSLRERSVLIHNIPIRLVDPTFGILCQLCPNRSFITLISIILTGLDAARIALPAREFSGG